MTRLFFVLCAILLAGCSRKSGTNALRVGMDLSYPPFEMQDVSGNPAGASVEIAQEMAASLGRPLEIVPMEFSGLIPALKSGNIDLILSSMTATDERRKSIDFSEPYAFTGLAMLVRKDSDIHSIDDLKAKAKTVTAKAGTTGEIWETNHLPDKKRVAFEDQAACVAEVVQGRADAFIYDQLSIYQYAKQNPETTRGLLKPFVEESWAVGVRKGNGALLAQVNDFLKDFRASSGPERIGEKFLKDEKAFLESQGIPFILR